jgi:glutamate formiminotransferase
MLNTGGKVNICATIKAVKANLFSILVSGMKLFECVANLSAGRDLHTIDQCTAAIARCGATLLHCDSGFDADRTVITFVGDEATIESSILGLAEAAYRFIDVRANKGNHPYIGSLDVCPVVPLFESTIEEAKGICIRVATSLWEQFRVPVFLYADSSTGDIRRFPSYFRRGGYTAARQQVISGGLRPDAGNRWNDRNGATILGARPLMVACNIGLSENGAGLAKIIAKDIRSNRDSLNFLGGVEAMGWYQESRNCSQVSMNLRELGVCNFAAVYNHVSRLAREHGVSVIGTEFIGLIPERLLLDAKLHLGIQSDGLEETLEAIGAHAFGEFLPAERILEHVLQLERSEF